MRRPCDNCGDRSGQSGTELVQGSLGHQFMVCQACIRQYGLRELQRWMSQAWLPLGKPRPVEKPSKPLRTRRAMKFEKA